MKVVVVLTLLSVFAIGAVAWYNAASQPEQTACMRIRDCHFPEKGPLVGIPTIWGSKVVNI
ncbi:MAG: hypothetical protein KatS3mg070_2861 [Meiothermus sp.]|uniref:hypothetical protein n=1 Tax=Meiothermus sp. TaxID=1955249 RepID=UPI0021DCDA97|nr:hypothetical protein [Meiothermus sp.]GIW29498.1 MAG: hypothetical protein KatS3mg070_2861 [Meiothermus sp.]